MSYFEVPNHNLIVSDDGLNVYRVLNGKRTDYTINTHRNGYKYIQATIGKQRRTLMIHRLVAMACIPRPDGKDEVNHIDGDKSNNLYTNLEWVSRSENMKHAFSSGLMKKGQKKKDENYKVRNDAIRFLSVNGYSRKDLASIFKQSEVNIGMIVRGELKN